MENFLFCLTELISESNLPAAELIGCLEIAKAELLESLFANSENEA